jgi:hypothetical protein
MRQFREPFGRPVRLPSCSVMPSSLAKWRTWRSCPFDWFSSLTNALAATRYSRRSRTLSFGQAGSFNARSAPKAASRYRSLPLPLRRARSNERARSAVSITSLRLSGDLPGDFHAFHARGSASNAAKSLARQRGDALTRETRLSPAKHFSHGPNRFEVAL